MAQARRKPIQESKSAESKGQLFDAQISRPTTELVVGMVGPVGAGVTKASQVIRDILEVEYGYSVSIIKASKVIKDNSARTSVAEISESGAKRITDLQLIGNELRERYGGHYVAAKIIEDIAIGRKSSGGYNEETQVPQPITRRIATIIDSLKHPEESRLLRRVYGGMYWQFTIFAPEDVREARLKALGVDKEHLSGIFTRDENDKSDHGQKVSGTAYLSDFFIRNDGQNDESLRDSVRRFLEMIFGVSVHTPTLDESGMHAAVSAATRSACLSRQVGAAIFSGQGELVSVGWNDVPKFRGGLYAETDKQDDHRCFKWSDRVCHNDQRKEKLYSTIYDQLVQSGLIKEAVSLPMLRSALVKTPVRHLIEYSRSIHAEMEAIVSAARSGAVGIVGGTLYTTTFPCHNCARHIVAAGISRVIYIEPYAKSLALDLHRDAISMVGSSGDKVEFLQYEGIGPDSVLKLFHHGVERKADGRARVLDKKSAHPVLPPPMDGFTTHEKRVISELERIERRFGAGS